MQIITSRLRVFIGGIMLAIAGLISPDQALKRLSQALKERGYD